MVLITVHYMVLHAIQIEFEVIEQGLVITLFTQVNIFLVWAYESQFLHIYTRTHLYLLYISILTIIAQQQKIQVIKYMWTSVG